MATMEPTARRQAPSLGQVVARLIGEARQLVADYAELTVLDARRAAIRLAWILGCVLVAAVLIVTSWMGLVAAAIVFAWGHGASWPIALAIAAVLNIVAAAVLAWFTLKLAKELPFTALLRQMRGRDPEPPQ
ncbi:MAG: phage holin family protein [Betaproteobacteria bacterium]|nr:MAG: phage holin family protein [Betaproteobacteria bacterium]TMH45699.1 MAG: phage holin family protein [Betaproteobacteria bacterium]